MKSSLTTCMKTKNRCCGSAPVFSDFGAQMQMWMGRTQSGTIIYSIQTGQYSGELSANFD